MADEETMSETDRQKLQDDAFAEAIGVTKEEPIYTYRNKAIRNYKVDTFEFDNHILQIIGDERNDQWLRLLKTLPWEEKVQIVVWHPEVLKNLESEVDFTPSTARGTLRTTDIKDPKTTPAVTETRTGISAFGNLNLKN